MSGDVTLIGYRFSVYTRSVRMALAAKGVAHDYTECDPFDESGADWLRARHPFGRVPVLEHAGIGLWETQAILDYVDAAFVGSPLVPETPLARARMRQVMGITDAYLYWPLVRQAFSHGVFRPAMGEPRDPGKLRKGLAAAPRVLEALEEIAKEGDVLQPGRTCLGACLLWPMLDYFTMLEEGAAMLRERPELSRWAGWVAQSPAAAATRPVLTQGGST